jgi:predicted HAD superfamily hydrolase
VIARSAVENLSWLYGGFSAWLVEQVRRHGYKRIYFASRDGFVMKRFFDVAAGAAGISVDSRYLYVSRTALYPTLVLTDPRTARRLFCHSWDHLTIAEALKRMLLSYEEVIGHPRRSAPVIG